MRIYLVGGAVRDMLMQSMGQDPPQGRDRDFLVTGATVEQFMAAFPHAKQVGKAFPVFMVGHDEYAFPRGETLEADLAARDLTVNAVALPVEEARPEKIRKGGPDLKRLVSAHPLAVDDIRGRVLRPASDTALSDDPVRVYRAARFAASWPDYVIHAELSRAMSQAARLGLLDGPAPERVAAELRKALGAARPGRFLEVLAEAGCLEPWFRELARAHGIPAGPAPFHDRSLLGHTAQVMDRLAELRPGDELAAWTGLCHDLGKTATPSHNHPHHHGHDALGEPLAEQLGRRLALPERFVRAGAAAAREHMRLARYRELRPGTRVDLLARLHAARITDELCSLVEADHGAQVREEVMRDMQAILAVTLPPEDRDHGPESGERLRQLRCQALTGA